MTPRDNFREKWGHRFGLDDETINLMFALEALIDAKLSPAPVGAPRAPCSDKCMAGIECDNACRKTPTPPAATSDGGESVRAYHYAVSLFGHLAPQCEPLDDLLGVLTQIDNATTVIPSMHDRIASLEVQLAEATNELHCCDDVHLDGGLASGIGTLRRQRDEATALVERLRGALTLAANRLDLLGVGLVPGSRAYVQAGDWVIEARGLLSETQASEGREPANG